MDHAGAATIVTGRAGTCGTMMSYFWPSAFTLRACSPSLSRRALPSLIPYQPSCNNKTV